ncbi:MAG: gamma-butyrobetaine hydroxylase-like domain-containing protein [Planctomycetota bacterium]
MQRQRGLTVEWADGSRRFYSVAHLRRLSPSAEARSLREEMSRNPLAVLPASADTGPLTIDDVELVGNYALRIKFSDGHQTGIYSWPYLRQIDPHEPPPDETAPAGDAPDAS